FVEADIETWRGDRVFDVVLCSGTFEHLHPDCRSALTNIRAQLADEAQVFIDFIRSEVSDCHFEASGTYIRQYPRDVLVAIFRGCGLRVHKVDACTLGQGAFEQVERFVVVPSKERAAGAVGRRMDLIVRTARPMADDLIPPTEILTATADGTPIDQYHLFGEGFVR